MTTYHIICDPVHGIMEFEKNIKDDIKAIIDTDIFQRLRHIKQLSFAEYAYPGAVHTRFNHCLGAAYLASKVSSKLPETEANAKEITLAALMHDIGHGPFSHAFEKIYGAGYKVNHEAWGKKFIFNLKEKFQLNSRLVESIEKAETILFNDNSVKHEIISSQLDVDRFDYLLRDSHFCGVSYGLFDVDWLISCMKVNNEKLVITSKGIKGLEHYLMARRLMHHNVYYHKKSSSAVYLLKKFFEYLSKYIIDGNIDRFLQNLPIIEYIQKIDKIKERHPVHDKFEVEVIEQLYPFYSKLTEHDIWSLIYYFSSIKPTDNRSQSGLIEISRNFIQRKLPIVYQIRPSVYKSVKLEIDSFKNDNQDIKDYYNWTVEIEEPTISMYGDSETDIEIFVAEYADENSPNFPISNIVEHSDIIKNFLNKKDKLSYLYVNHIDDYKVKTKVNDFIKKLKDNNCFMPWERIIH
jgi:HD superfamily phosphohydrolase